MIEISNIEEPEEIKRYRKNLDDNRTVGYLLKFIKENNIPDDAIILYQRIEDYYFEKGNWIPVKKEGDRYHNIKKHQEDCSSGGKYRNIKNYPKAGPEWCDEQLRLIEELGGIEKELDDNKEQYIVSWCPVKYRDDKNLYIDAHY